MMRLMSLLMLCASTAHAHTDSAVAGGFTTGFVHPLAGLDHLLAMVAVGIWGATLGPPLLWALPVVFPLLMVAGAIAGMAGTAVPMVEAGIALSVLLLGLAIYADWKAHAVVAVTLVAMFGVLHGHAHGMELPRSAEPAAYSAGFVFATGILHLAGIALGTLRTKPIGRLLLRTCGALIAAVGLWLLLRN